MSKGALRAKAIRKVDKMIGQYLRTAEVFREGLERGANVLPYELKYVETELRNARIRRRALELMKV